MKKILFVGAIISILSCSSEKIKTDLLVKNATIYTVNQGFDIAEAFIVWSVNLTSKSVPLKSSSPYRDVPK